MSAQLSDVSAQAAARTLRPVAAACRPLLTLGVGSGHWQAPIAAVLEAAFEAPLTSPCLGDWLAQGGSTDGFPSEALPSSQPWGVLDTRLFGALDALAAHLPAARYLLVIESPSMAIAAGDGDSTAQQRLQAWTAAAQQALGLIRRRRGQCLVVALDEVLGDPEGLVAAMEGQFGLSARDSLQLTLAAHLDAVDELLGQTVLRGRPAAQALYEELLASCQPLGGGASEPEVLPRRDPARDAQLAGTMIDHLRQLRHEVSRLEAAVAAAQATQQSTQAELSARQSALQALQAERSQDRAEQARQQQQIDQLRSELVAAQRQGKEAQEEAELLLLQLHQVQEELETLFLGRREIDSKLDEASKQLSAEKAAHEASKKAAQAKQKDIEGKLAAEKKAAQTQRSQLEAQLTQSQADLAKERSALGASRQQLETAKREAKTLGERLAKLETRLTQRQIELDESRQEGELLLAQLHMVQEELEHYFLLHRDAERRELELEQAARRAAEAATAAEAARRRAADVDIGQCQVEHERLEAPHRELSLSLTAVRIGERQLDALSLRVVEHHGRPGLVLFGPAEGEPPLSGWVEHGREDGRPYMLVLPSDSSFDAVWRRLPRSDWQLIAALPGTLATALDEQKKAAPLWTAVLRRLACQLTELPARLRYDAIHVEPGDNGQHRIDFIRVLFGTRQMPTVRLRWQPAQQALWLIHPENIETLPALTSWPRDADGNPQDAWRIPLSGDTLRARLHAWDAISRGDRELVLALLDALPAATEQMPESATRRREAAELLQRALTELAGGRLKRALRHRLTPQTPIRA